MTTLTKTQFLLVGFNLMERVVSFHRSIADQFENAPSHAVQLDRETWEDMGCPTLVTVTVEPGDTLNED